MAESRFTRVGVNLWHCPWFVELEDREQVLWLVLYSSAAAKRSVPGLWHGGIGTIADACPHWASSKVLSSLDVLIDRELAQFDRNYSVLRLTRFPDGGERAHNALALAGWWNRFRLVPQCRVRDAHVASLRWLLDQGEVGEKMCEVWRQTFATISESSSSSGAARSSRLTDSDTSTGAQPSLFGSVNLPSEGIQEVTDTRGGTKHPSRMDAPSTGSGSGSGLGSGSGSGSPDGVVVGSVGAGQGLQLVVPEYTAEEFLSELARGYGTGVASVHAVVRDTLRAALYATIRDLSARGIPLVDVSLAGKLAASAMPPLQRQWPSCHPDELLCVWASQPGVVVSAIQRVRESDRLARERSAMLHGILAEGAGG